MQCRKFFATQAFVKKMRPAGERNEIFWNNLVSAARRRQKVAWSTRHVIIPAFLLIRAAEIGALSWLLRITCVCVLPGGITAALGWNKAKYLPSANLMRVSLLKRARAERINCATRNVCCPAVVSQRAWCCTGVGARVITIITHRTHPQSTYCCCLRKSYLASRFVCNTIFASSARERLGTKTFALLQKTEWGSNKKNNNITTGNLVASKTTN